MESEEHRLIEACMVPPDEASDVEAHNGRLRQLEGKGYRLRQEPLYDAQGYSVAWRIGLFAIQAGYRPRLVEQRFYWRGRDEGAPWRPISEAQAMRYRDRFDHIMAGW
mgnify:CR=1 FL=1